MKASTTRKQAEICEATKAEMTLNKQKNWYMLEPWMGTKFVWIKIVNAIIWRV